MATGLEAIETEYLGLRFRSRLEARWACFFKTLGVRFHYELEGFELGAAGRYLPDFWLPDHQCWIEIKPDYPDERERRKLQALAHGERGEVFLFARPDFQPPSSDIWADAGRGFSGAWGYRFSQYASPGDIEGDFGAYWTQCTECIMEGVVRRDGSGRFTPGRRTFGISSSDAWTAHMQQEHGEHGWSGMDCDETPDLVEAYRAARQARFEFGESGTR